MRGWQVLTILPMLSAMALCQAVMICSVSCCRRNSELSRVRSCGDSGSVRQGQAGPWSLGSLGHYPQVLGARLWLRMAPNSSHQ